jgi:carboxyl-terminal processing protease
LTMQMFYRVNGDSTQNRGVNSDVVLPSLSEYLATPEKELDYALPFDHVNATDHDNVGMVSPELKAMLKARSAERVRASKDFAKLAKDVERLKGVLKRKRVPLNEQELKEQMKKEDEDQDKTRDTSEPKMDDPVYKFPRTFTNNEVLRIVEDMLQGTVRAPVQGRRQPERKRGVPVLTTVHDSAILTRSVSEGPRLRFGLVPQ